MQLNRLIALIAAPLALVGLTATPLFAQLSDTDADVDPDVELDTTGGSDLLDDNTGLPDGVEDNPETGLPDAGEVIYDTDPYQDDIEGLNDPDITDDVNPIDDPEGEQEIEVDDAEEEYEEDTLNPALNDDFGDVDASTLDGEDSDDLYDFSR